MTVGIRPMAGVMPETPGRVPPRETEGSLVRIPRPGCTDGPMRGATPTPSRGVPTLTGAATMELAMAWYAGKPGESRMMAPEMAHDKRRVKMKRRTGDRSCISP